MKIVLQRVSEARVEVNGRTVGEIGIGLVILLGIAQGDSESEIDWGVNKICELRIFPDSAEKFNRSLEEVGGSVLVVSQFTLFGDIQKGRRPSFFEAAAPEVAIPLYERFVSGLRNRGITTSTGVFGAKMQVFIVNDGPVTLVIEKKMHN